MAVVLIVEDTTEIREFLVQALSDEGYHAIGAENGEAALDVVRQVQADVIVLDYSMPVMDARAFLERYRDLPEQRAGIILLTAAVSAGERARALGVQHFLGKPFDLDELFALIDELAESDAGSAAP